MISPGLPQTDEFAPAFAGYVNRAAGAADPLSELTAQRARVRERLAGLTDEQASFRYAPEKWSIKTIVGHLADAERIFAYRMLWTARGDTTPVPSFDENAYAEAAQSDRRPFGDLLDEWLTVRDATTALARSVPEQAWTNRGTSSSGSPITARAQLYIILGHTEHHLNVLAERYRV
jgi:hypothetical protein